MLTVGYYNQIRESAIMFPDKKVHTFGAAIQPKKTGPNDPCPCNSGQKFKKCCAAKIRNLGLQQHSSPATDRSPSVASLQAAADLLNRGDYGSAELNIQSLLKSYPDSLDCWKLLGLALTGLGKSAVEAHRHTVRLAPEEPESHILLARALTQIQEYESALRSLNRALKVDPKSVFVHADLCAAYLASGAFEKAKVHMEEVQRIAPSSIEFHLVTASWYAAAGLFDIALEHAEIAKKMDPAYPMDRWVRGVLAQRQDQRSLKEQKFYAGLIAQAQELAHVDLALEKNVANHNFLLMCIHANPQRSANDYFLESRNWAVQHGNEDALPHPSTYANDLSPQRRLKVGILGDYFASSICMYTLVPFFRLYDCDRLEVICYNYGDDRGFKEAQLQLVDQWKNIHDLEPDQFFDLVQSDQIDIMLDINGRLRNPRFFSAMLRKPAPIQVNWYNLTATVGHRAYNYLIADEYSIRAGEEDQYVEKIFKMPTGTISSWDMDEPPPVPTALPCAQNGFVMFSSFGDFFKVNEGVLETWGKLLLRVPNSRLYLKGQYLQAGENRKRIEDFFSNMGIAKDRLLLEGISTYHLMKLRYGIVDIALDTFPYSGGSTTINALWQGVPVIAISGVSWRERNAASILAGAGLLDLIATDVDDYIERAVSLANDMDRLKHYRQTIAQTLSKSPQWQTKEFAINFERTLRAMWLDWIDQSNAASLDS